VLIAYAGSALPQGASESARWRLHARAVSIVRDPWGIAHVYGRSDADAVFGTIYAQAEDDFRRIEHNYLTALGRLAEAEGEWALYSDLRQRLFVDPGQLRLAYRSSPLNFYLAGHPAVKPRLITAAPPMAVARPDASSPGGEALPSRRGVVLTYCTGERSTPHCAPAPGKG